MTQQGMPNPIDLYEAAVQNMIPIIVGVKPNQLNDSTPCSEWNVQALLNHNIKVAQIFHGVVAGSGPMDFGAMQDVSGPLPAEGAHEAFLAATNNGLQAVKSAGALEKVIDTPMGSMPLADLIMLAFGDLFIHKWDLAKGTNQDTSLDSALAEAALNALAPGVDGGRQGGFYGAEVVVPASASVQDRLLGVSGRQP